VSEDGKRLRLLKVVVVPTFVVDDGETLDEKQAQPIEVAPADWPTFATEVWPGLFAQAAEQLVEPGA
jgi:hypothetical protein